MQPHTQLECAWHNIVESNQRTNERIDCMHMLLPFLKNFSNSSIVTGETDKQSELKRMSCNTFFELSMYQCSTSSSSNISTQANALTQHTRSICCDIKTKIKTDKKRNAQPTSNGKYGTGVSYRQAPTANRLLSILLWYCLLMFLNRHAFELLVPCSSFFSN